MKQMLFETRQKADELLREALSIWRQSDQVDALEGIEKDPVFSLLMMALAYQANELDSELERLKTEVLEDFAKLLVPYEKGHAIPATAVVETALQENVPEMTMGESQVFKLSSEYPFIPLLETRILNAEVSSVVRLDGRRWKVSLGFNQPVTDLSRFAFAVKDVNFRDIVLTVKGKPLPLIRPWQYAELPLVSCFAPESMTYNLGQQQMLSSLPMDLFARQNIRYDIIDCHSPRQFVPSETEKIDLVFEFMGISDDFHFDKNCILLNPVVLVNAQVNEATLSSAAPLVRIAGGEGSGSDAEISKRQFMHLVRPLESQLFSNLELEVRGVAGDRFNQGSLVKLLQCIITKYHSDFYAFQSIKGVTADNAMFQLETALSRLKQESTQNLLRSVSGVYLMPRGLAKMKGKEFSLNVKYLTTAGAALNSILREDSTFSVPSGFNPSATRSVAAPVPGTDEIRDEAALGSMLRYYMVTGDRIVTMADIKLFCIKELMVKYGISAEMIRHLRVDKRLQRDAAGCGYEIVAEITLADSSFVKRNFADKLPMAELLLQKMIEVRSANIYPIQVSIAIEEDK